MAAAQIPFDIPVREAFEAEDYLVTKSNQAAVDWVDRWPNWGEAHCAILYGTSGCGKTHLSHVWQYRSGAIRQAITANHIVDYQDIPDCLILEDIDQILDTPHMQEKLFHIYNWQKEKGGYMMLTSRAHPKNWPSHLPDLKSRMLASMIIEIGIPDDELLAAVIIKQFMDRQIHVSAEVVNFLILRIERSFSAARRIVNQVDKLALSQKRKITIPLIRELFE